MAGSWRVRLANAIAVRGYASIDLRAVRTTPFVPLDAALERAASSFQSPQTPVWQSIAQHFRSLKSLGVEMLSIRGKSGRLLLVLTRLERDGSLELSDAARYHVALDQWLGALSDYLPQASLSASEGQAVAEANDWVGRYTGSSAVGWMAAKLLSVLAGSDGQGVCVTVHPIAGPVGEAYSSAWARTDLTTEHFLTRKIHSSNYLWDTTTLGLYPGAGGGVENPLDWNFEPSPQDLYNLVTSVNDE